MRVTFLRVAVVVSALAASSVARAAGGAGAGDNIVSASWAHFSVFNGNNTPQTTTLSPLITQVLGGPADFTSPDTQLTVSDADTAALVFTHFFTDHIALQFAGGYPAEFQLTGHGTIAAGSPLAIAEGNARYQPLIKSVREWNPALIVDYYFNRPDVDFRPFVGVGFTYTWFSHVQLNNQFLSTYEGNFSSIAPLVGAKGPVSIAAKASSTFAPVFNLGMSYHIAGNFYASASVNYSPLKTNTELDIRDANGTLLGASRSQLRLTNVITTLGIGYAFSL